MIIPVLESAPFWVSFDTEKSYGDLSRLNRQFLLMAQILSPHVLATRARYSMPRSLLTRQGISVYYKHGTSRQVTENSCVSM